MPAMEGVTITKEGASMVPLEGADADGTHNGQVLVGSKVVVFEERKRGRRSMAAVQAALDAIGESESEVDGADFEADVRRVKDRGGLVAKSLEKVACDERLWDKSSSRRSRSRKESRSHQRRNWLHSVRG